MSVETWVHNLLSFYDVGKDTDESWYDKARGWCSFAADQVDADLDVFAAFIAVLSPRTRWETQIKYAVAMWLHLAAGGSAETCPGPGTYAMKRRAARIVQGEPIESILSPKTSPKTYRFWRNLLGMNDVATVDTWIVRAAENENIHEDGVTLKINKYTLYESALYQGAAIRGVPVDKFQARVWGAVKEKWDKNQMPQSVFMQT